MATVTGKVLEDKSGKGIPNVVVSDGKAVARTDENGRYELEVDPERRKISIVFVTLPEGYTAPAGAANTPQFFARIKDLKAGETREQNFTLIRDCRLDGKEGKFIFITDTHVGKYANPSLEIEKERFVRQIKQLNRLTYDADFIISNGDFGDQATAEEFKAYTEAAALSSLAIWPSAGNHDLRDVNGDRSYKSYVENYRAFIGPEWYSFDYRGYHIVVLETYIGQNESDQLEWLKRDLAMIPENKKVIVVSHVPFNTPSAQRIEGFIELLRQYRVRLVLTGHHHSNDVDPNVFPGAEHIQTAPFWEPQDGNPEGFRVVSVGEDDHLSHEFITLGIEKKLTIVNPGPDQVVESGVPLDIQVNAYDTCNEIKGIRCQIDGKGWYSLKRVSSWTWAVDEKQAQPVSEGSHSMLVVVEAAKSTMWRECCTFKAVDAGRLNKPHTGSGWHCLHGDNLRSGHAKDAVTPPLRLAWTYNSGGTILASSPALVGGMVYIGIHDVNGIKKHGIAAIDALTGKEKWCRVVDAPVDATPALVNGIVYFSGIRGTIHAFSAQTGETVWEHRTGVQGDGVQRAWSQASPAVVGGMVYQSLGSKLIALDAKTGEEKWTFRSAVDGHGDTDRQGAALVYDGIVYFTGDGRYVVAVSVKTGQELWKYYPTVPSRFRTGATAADGRIYLHGEAGQVEVIDAKTGEYLWHYHKPFYSEGRSYIAIADGSVIYTAGEYLVSVDSKTGQEQWSFRTGGNIESSPAVSGGTVYVGSKDGNFYAVDRKTGEKVWSYAIGTWINSSPAVSGNMVIVGAYDGNVYGFAEV